MKEKRLNAIDLCNAALCVFVVFIHLASEPVGSYDKGSALYLLFFAAHKTCSFAVPAFIALSGFKMAYKFKDGGFRFGDFIKGRILKIYLPYLAAAISYYCYFLWRGFVVFDAGGLINKLLLGTVASPFYFIVIIFQFYLLMPLWARILKTGAKSGVALLAVAVLITLITKQILPAAISARFADTSPVYAVFVRYNDRIFPSYLLYWVMGCLTALHRERVEKWLSHWGRALAVSLPVAGTHIALSYLFSRGMFRYAYAEAAHIVFCAASITALYAVCLAVQGRMRPGTRASRLIADFGGLTFDIYLWHCLFIYIADHLFYDRGIISISLRFALRLAMVCPAALLAALALHGAGKTSRGLAARSRPDA